MKGWMNDDAINIVLSRRNILSLLTKLDGRPQNSACTIFKYLGDDIGMVIISTEEDEFHYEGKTPGIMHPETEENLSS